MSKLDIDTIERLKNQKLFLKGRGKIFTQSQLITKINSFYAKNKDEVGNLEIVKDLRSATIVVSDDETFKTSLKNIQTFKFTEFFYLVM